MDFIQRVRQVKKGIDRARVARERAEAAAAAALAAETDAWGELFALPGMNPEVASALTGFDLAVCKTAEAAVRARRGRV